jgi:hypothetical protein
VNTRINILERMLTNLGTYLVLKRIWNLIDFQGHRSKVKVTGSIFFTVSFENRSVTFLELNDDNTTIGPFVLVIVLICITYLLLTLARED